MADITIRKNERCVIGLPTCGYVFSSTRSCFIGYGFKSSHFEMEILRNILEKRGIEAIEAGQSFDPAKFVFCTKICSKIITSQFCAIFMNNDIIDKNGSKSEIPNGNVNMEYGLMLGHNKYVIPFQLENQKLPFNVSGLDTIKYTPRTFKERAEKAVDQAIEETSQKSAAADPNQIVREFLLLMNSMPVILGRNQDEQIIYDLGAPLGFNLLVKFDGLSYTYFGNFPNLRYETVIWRITKLLEVLTARLTAIEIRKSLGITSDAALAVLAEFLKRLELWILVNGEPERQPLLGWAAQRSSEFPLKIFTMSEVGEAVATLP